jgi:cbb3-type cytochrome oxidase subunit 3
MIRNVVIGMVLIIGTGALLNQPSVTQPMQHNKIAHYAVAGFLIALAIFVLASIWHGLRKKPAQRTGTPYAAPAKRR